MPLTIEELEQKLLSLPESNRIRIAATLLHSFPVPEGIWEDGTPEFEAELARRHQEIVDGTVELIPYEVVMRELKEMLQQG